MTRAELIDLLAMKQSHIPVKMIEQGVKSVFENMAQALESGQRIEIRRFGSFSIRYREPRTARNPKTGEVVHAPGKYAPHFKPGKEMRERVDASKETYPIKTDT